MVLFPNLPDEIAEDCLARVTYKSHHNLKSVSRAWRSLLKSPHFYDQRKAAGAAEQRIFMLQSFPLQHQKSSNQQKTSPVYGIAVYDPVQGEWQRVPSIPELGDSVPLFSRCVSVKGKFILIGGWHPSNWQPINSVFIYDVLSGGWTRGADIPTLRCFFGCCVSPDGIIYVAGGHDQDKNALRSVEAYNVEKDEWESLPTMSKGRDECEAVFTDGQMVVVSGFETESQWRFERSAEIFNPQTRAWKVVENMWRRDECPRSSVVAARGQLYFFSLRGVIRYNATENSWAQVVNMPEDVSVSPCATAACDKIFVSGGDTGCYMFEPQHGKWAAIQRPQGFRGFVQCAAILEF
ncbi:hypothetical protein SUGI_0000670 [Cryptomeria japonica]|uniref:F-box/kelch-repeat protein SKIP20 n=1 Tax=Cryptomeria japonica TaxID=3369 RepID=UPI002408B251|nr:F-box/kelch-repeat protein SKIP20 [Cryptomeria japonica]GLJ04652.1 hypothetical protein SUGI_0000670 [Cryptomeria japonica]